MKRQRLPALLVWAGFALWAPALAGCGDDTQATPDGSAGDGGGGSGGSPMAASRVTNAAAFSQPLDAVPSRDGTTIYFTAFDGNGVAQVWKVAAAGGAPTAITTGGPLEVPTGLAIAPDDTRLYIADLTAARGSNGAIGGLFTLALPAGGTPAALSGGDAAIYPIAITVSNDGHTLFFTGGTAADATPAVFSMPSTGGTATAITSGGALSDPSGIAVDGAGTVYVVDTTAGGETSASVFKLNGSGAPTMLAQNLRVGFPAGLTLGQDGHELIVSAAPHGGAAGVILSVPLGGGNATSIDFSSAGVVSPAGLHRAANVNIYALADDLAANMGTDQTGAIFKLQ